MKSGNPTLLKERQQLISMNTKWTADQRIYQNPNRYWQSDADKLQGKIDRTGSENERLRSVYQQLAEMNDVLAVDRQHLQAAQK